MLGTYRLQDKVLGRHTKGTFGASAWVLSYVVSFNTLSNAWRALEVSQIFPLIFNNAIDLHSSLDIHVQNSSNYHLHQCCSSYAISSSFLPASYLISPQLDHDHPLSDLTNAYYLACLFEIFVTDMSCDQMAKGTFSKKGLCEKEALGEIRSN